ncbi:unnamed protein product [Polarella glacialis]|nr:unnamed protein product [Polarella glacialis]
MQSSWRRAGIRVGRCPTTSGALRFVRREGTVGVPVLALPGAAGRAEHVIFDGPSSCAGAWTTVALDWPGSGESTDAWPRWSTKGLAALVLEVLDAFGWPRVIIIGHSLGSMVAMHLVADPRVLGVVLLAPSPGLLPCLRAGIWPLPLYSVLVLTLCALSLCNPLAVQAASRSDLNRAWLLHGLEGRSLCAEGLAAAQEASRPRSDAPGGLVVWLQRRLGDLAALIAVLTHNWQMPLNLSPSAYLAVLWGSQDALIDARASRLAADLLEESGAEVHVQVSPESGHFLRWGAPGLVATVLRDVQSGIQPPKTLAQIPIPTDRVQIPILQ